MKYLLQTILPVTLDQLVLEYTDVVIPQTEKSINFLINLLDFFSIFKKTCFCLILLDSNVPISQIRNRKKNNFDRHACMQTNLT